RVNEEIELHLCCQRLVSDDAVGLEADTVASRQQPRFGIRRAEARRVDQGSSAGQRAPELAHAGEGVIRAIRVAEDFGTRGRLAREKARLECLGKNQRQYQRSAQPHRFKIAPGSGRTYFSPLQTPSDVILAVTWKPVTPAIKRKHPMD